MIVSSCGSVERASYDGLSFSRENFGKMKRYVIGKNSGRIWGVSGDVHDDSEAYTRDA